MKHFHLETHGGLLLLDKDQDDSRDVVFLALEALGILKACHVDLLGDTTVPIHTARGKNLSIQDSIGPTFKDALDFVTKSFDIWGIDFMGPQKLFPSSNEGTSYILLWLWTTCQNGLKQKALPTIDARVVCKFLKKLLFSRFVIVHPAIIRDRGNSLLQWTNLQRSCISMEYTTRSLHRISPLTNNVDKLMDFPDCEDSLACSIHMSFTSSASGWESMGTLAYRLELPEKLSRVHSTFHVSNLKKYLVDEPLAISLDEIKIDDKLNFIEEPVEIMDQEVKRLKQSRIPIVKVRWNSRLGSEFTWEREDQMKKKYPHLFVNPLYTS
ncbi:hypothetical protein Tco_0893265 [Tanacetum coccineum]|uniref:Tf2-1-like SH3-like domain-containing protein n=1 Tax=Tanacetum coccineum TaxID=301880 RepID=A0ABQ5CB79_9ASTR